jgi:uncharacterized protein YkwD
MRKPLVVVCGVAAAVLIGGGIYATTAGADEGPGVPAVPGLDFPGVPAFPQFAGDADQPHVTFPDLGDDDQGWQQNADDPNADDQNADHQATDDQQTDGQGADDQQTDGQGADDQQADDQSADDQDATSQRPGGQAAAAQQRPGHQQPAQRPANGRPVQQKPANVMAAAQRDVSPASVSTSPAAPVQQQMLALVNQNRRRGGCDNLSLDRRLIVAANGHAADMARRDYFAHESPNGDGSSDRMSEAGYRWSRYGENIARGQDSVYEVVNGWMHSPVHRENIMDCKLEQMGIGLAFAPDRTPYWVQDFGTPR